MFSQLFREGWWVIRQPNYVMSCFVCSLAVWATLGQPPGAIAAVPCPLRVSGLDRASQQALKQLLARREPGNVAARACDRWVVKLRAERDHFRIVARDAFGRRIERVVEDLDTVAVLLNSWRDSELAHSLLRERTRGMDRVVPGSPPEASPQKMPRIALSLHGEAAAGFGRGAAYGGRFAACVRFSLFCAGAALRLAHDDPDQHTAGGSKLNEIQLSHRDQIALTASLYFATQLRWRRWGLAPWIAGGLTRITRQVTIARVARNPPMPPVELDHVGQTVIGPSGEAGATVSYRITRTTALEAGLSLSVFPSETVQVDSSGAPTGSFDRRWQTHGRVHLGLSLGLF